MNKGFSGFTKFFGTMLIGYREDVNKQQLHLVDQNFGAGATRSWDIWLELEPSLWPGFSSTLNICLIIHEN